MNRKNCIIILLLFMIEVTGALLSSFFLETLPNGNNEQLTADSEVHAGRRLIQAARRFHE